MKQTNPERSRFIERLNEEFLSHTGYGAYAYLSSFDGIELFDEFSKQSTPADVFIKSYVRELDIDHM